MEYIKGLSEENVTKHRIFLILVQSFSMKTLSLAITFFFCQILLAQDSTSILIEAGKRFTDVITPALMFRYTQFKTGKVLFRNGVSSEAKLNYNLFNGEIMFISPGADTLAIAKDQMLNIKRVIIDTSCYVYNKGYLEVLRENVMGTMARRQQYFVVTKEKIGGYDLASPASSIDSYTSFTEGRNNPPHNLLVRENISLQLKTEYFIGDAFQYFLPVNKKNLDKIFFKRRNELDAYLKEHTIDYKNEKDITALFIFLTESL